LRRGRRLFSQRENPFGWKIFRQRPTKEREGRRKREREEREGERKREKESSDQISDLNGGSFSPSLPLSLLLLSLASLPCDYQEISPLKPHATTDGGSDDDDLHITVTRAHEYDGKPTERDRDREKEGGKGKEKDEQRIPAKEF